MMIMTRDKVLDKAARAMLAQHDPGHAPDGHPWHARALDAYRRRFKTGLDAVEDDIRRDERNRIIAWLREVAKRDVSPYDEIRLRMIADELDRKPIDEE